MTRSKTAILILVIAMFTSSGVAHSEDITEELKACARMTDQDERLACLDDLGERALREESDAIKPTQEEEVRPEVVAETATAVQPLPDDLGSSNPVQYGGLITSCKKGYYGDLYFVFDNGQVWKQVSDRNLRVKDCHFNATLTKDTFGYKMKIDGIDGTIRVKRSK